MRLHLALFGVFVCSVIACSSTDATSSDTPNPDGAVAGGECNVGSDCQSGKCSDGRCTASTLSADPHDGQKNGTETDVDCGGTSGATCADGKACVTGGDCDSGSCKSGVCAAPAPDDGVKNADETDIDCGGAKAPKCAVGKTCAAHADCGSDACAYSHVCVEYKTCTAKEGGDTCGAGETGDPGAKHESCCTTVKVGDRPAGQGGAFEIDKYQLTAGRMRAIVERTNGDLQTWAKTAPGWNQAWTPMLPASMSDALYMLGPGGKRGCNVTSQGGRTYWQDGIDGNAAEKSDFSREVLDEKSLNCVTWYMAQAACAFDGKHLASANETAWVFENRGRAGGATSYPWQWKDMAAYSPTAADIRIVHVYSYQTPGTATLRMVGTGGNAYPLDHAFWIAPPGRRPDGANMHGVEDAAGNMLMWVSDGAKKFIWTMSWENHQKSLTATDWSATDGPDGYYAIGARCVK